MAKLIFGQVGEKFYETGARDMVLYPTANDGTYPAGVVWNGLTSFTEKPTGGDINSLYADDGKYIDLVAAESYEASLGAYMYPDEWAACNGEAELVAGSGVVVGQQERKPFGLCYRTTKGNDAAGDAYGYVRHLVYGGKASPSEKAHNTTNDSPDAVEMSWDMKCTPVPVPGKKPTASLEIPSSNPKIKLFEAILLGVDDFSTTSTYAVGDYVMYAATQQATKKLYKCTTAVTTAGAWDVSKWTEDTTHTPGPRLPLPTEVLSILNEA